MPFMSGGGPLAGTTRQEPKLSKPEALDAVPVRNHLCKEEETAGGGLLVLVPVRQSGWARFMKRLTYVPRYRKIELDEIGAFVWKQCDGRTSVRVLIDRLCKRFKLSYREGEVSLTQYLRSLAKRNLIGMAVNRADRAKAK